MRRKQPTFLFLLVVAAGLARLFAYAGMPFAQELSAAAILHYLALHMMTFTLAGLLVAALSRATATRSAQVALYAQGILFLAPFVDVGLGVPLDSYDATYTGLFGSPGALVSALAYGAVLAWGVWDASVGNPQARAVGSAAAAVCGVVGLSAAAIPWPGDFAGTSWGAHLILAVYFGLLAAVFEHAAIRFANPILHRGMWKEVQPLANLGFALLPLVGVVATGRFGLPPNPAEPFERFRIEAPFMVGAAAVAAALFIQWRLVRSTAWAPFQREAAVVAKLAAVALALLLGVGPFLAAGLAGSVLWFSRSRWAPIAFGVAAGLAVLVGDLTSVAVDFASVPIGPAVFLVPLNQSAPSLAGVASAVVVSVAVALGSWLTSRTSA